MAMLGKELQRIRLVELERIPRLRSVIDADNLKACAMVADSGPASAGK
jgi:hypothetical protein